MNLKEVGLEEILEAQSRQLAEKEEQDSLSTCPSHILTNPEFSIINCFFGFLFCLFRYVEIKVILAFCNLVGLLNENPTRTDQNKHGKKKSDFVDSGFVKTCDELVIGSKVFKERGLTYTSESIMDEHY